MTAQFPIDGKFGKAWKVTSYMGWRIHPITHDKRHHNGTDIWSPHEPCWIEAPYDAKVLVAGYSAGGYGYYVILRHKIGGKFYTTLYGHMAKGLKVKKGQSISAGTPIGKMASTGASTGKHLHWELHKGRTHAFGGNGAGFIEPVKFFRNLIEHEKDVASAPVPTPEDDPVQPAPIHEPTPKPTAKKPTPKGRKTA